METNYKNTKRKMYAFISFISGALVVLGFLLLKNILVGDNFLFILPAILFILVGFSVFLYVWLGK